ncbi:hypothetical protein JB92DRAFT_3141433 [Gautieria morchelliformis]|nr:hypothetical protein JB92DRAFT_3141433 [Gautieria morchelliformis]
MDAELSSFIASSLKQHVLPDYFNVAGVMLLIYDHMLTLDVEVGFTWSARWSVAKVLYLMVAYLSFSVSIVIFGSYASSAYLPSSCTMNRQACEMLLACLMCIGELILIFRTWVIFGRRKMLGIGLIVSSAATVALVLSIMVYSFEQIKYIPDPNPDRRRCLLIEGAGRIGFVNFVIFTGIDSVIVGMTMYHGRQHFRTSSSNIVVTLYRDGMLYYIYMLSFSIFNIVTMVAFSAMVLDEVQALLHAVLIKRILLNLRGAVPDDCPDYGPNDIPLYGLVTQPSAPSQQQHWPYLSPQVWIAKHDPRPLE